MSKARRRRPEVYARSAGSARLFAALGDETRLNVVSRLCAGGPLSIAKLAEGSSVTRQAITKHLSVLQRAGLVRGVRCGREMRFDLESEALDQARRALDEISRQWDVAFGKLKRFVERVPQKTPRH